MLGLVGTWPWSELLLASEVASLRGANSLFDLLNINQIEST